MAFALSLCSAFVYLIIFCRLFGFAEHHCILISCSKAVSDVSLAVPEGDKYPKVEYSALVVCLVYIVQDTQYIFIFL